MVIYISISILVIIACVLQIMIVLVQNSKGGGLAANFSAGQTMGVRKTADFLEKSTWTLAGAILVLCLVATASIPKGNIEKESVIKESIENAQDPNAIPVLPTPVPQEQQPEGGN